MKIAINTRFLLAGRLEGIGRYTHEVCRRLVEACPEHEFFFLFDRPYSETFCYANNVNPIVVPPPARHPVLWYAWFEWALPLALRYYKPDVLFSPDGYLSLSAKTPTVLTIHDLAFEHFQEHVPGLVNRYYRHFTPRYCRRAQHILTVSGYTAEDVAARYGISAEKVSVCGNAGRSSLQPLEESEKAEARSRYAEGAPYWLYVGAIHPRKNIHRLIEAFDAFKRQTGHPARLILAGRFAWQPGPVLAAFEAAAHKAHIHFTGFVPDEELPLLMGGAMGLVYPSLFEGFGLPLLEAMQVEVPIITSAVSSMPEVAGPAALLIDPYRVEDISSAMARLAYDEPLQQQLIACGRQQQQHYSWEKTAEIVAASLYEVANGGGDKRKQLRPGQ